MRFEEFIPYIKQYEDGIVKSYNIAIFLKEFKLENIDIDDGYLYTEFGEHITELVINRNIAPDQTIDGVTMFFYKSHLFAIHIKQSDHNRLYWKNAQAYEHMYKFIMDLQNKSMAHIAYKFDEIIDYNFEKYIKYWGN